MFRTPLRLRFALIGVAAVALTVLTPTASGGSGVGGNFNLGQLNVVNGQSILQGSSNLAMLDVFNTNTAQSWGIRSDSKATANNAFSIYGLLDPTTPGAGSAAVRGLNSGTNANGYGVWGSQAGSGTGVYGSTATGVGVSGLTGSSSHPAVVGHNTAGGPGLSAVVVPGVAPITVNSPIKVNNLNADMLDGQHATDFLAAGGTAANSSQLGGHNPDYFQQRVNGSCSTDQAMRSVDTAGTVVCEGFLPTGGTAADSSALGGNMPAFYQQRVSGTCGANKAIDGVNSDGTVTCQDVGGSGTVTEVDTGGGLTGGPITTSGTVSLKSNFQLPQGCSANQVPQWDGVSTWTCGSGGGGGGGWSLTGNTGTTPGVNFLGTTDNNALDLDVNSLRALLIQPSGNSTDAPNLIGGYASNSVTGGDVGSTIAGGGDQIGGPNSVSANYGSVGGGAANTVSKDDATVAGGLDNTASGFSSAIGGGAGSTASGDNSTIAGGLNNQGGGKYAAIGGGGGNQTSADYSAIAGGANNQASAEGASVLGGDSNTASGTDASVAGGNGNTAGGAYSLAAGRAAIASPAGSFVWGDSNSHTITAPAADTFIARANNGFWLGTDPGSNFTPPDPEGQATPMFLMTSTGAGITNSGTFVSSSDRAKKHDWHSLNKQAVLRKLAGIPIGSWSYKVEPKSIRHVGPMAQDFYSAFRLGGDNKTIGTVDEGGVALAAIQGLYHQNRALQRQNRTLNARLNQLERRVNRLARH